MLLNCNWLGGEERMGLIDEIKILRMWRNAKKDPSKVKNASGEMLEAFSKLDAIEAELQNQKSASQKAQSKEVSGNEIWEEYKKQSNAALERQEIDRKRREELDAIDRAIANANPRIEIESLIKRVGAELQNMSNDEKIALNNSLLYEEPNSDTLLYNIYKLNEWLKRTDTVKIHSGNWQALEQMKQKGGKKFYFDSFRRAGTCVYDNPPLLESFVCDHDGVDTCSRVACVPLDVDSFCKCLDYSSLSLVRSLADEIVATQKCPKRYAINFGWGWSECEKIKQAIEKRMRAFRTMIYEADERMYNENAEFFNAEWVNPDIIGKENN